MWILIDIGCLECCIPTNIVGVFTDEDKAKSLADKLSIGTGTDQSFEVFPMPQIDVIGKKYANADESLRMLVA